MKKIKKILSLAMALAISSSMLTAVNASAAQADSHGDVYAVYPTASSTLSEDRTKLTVHGAYLYDVWAKPINNSYPASLKYDSETDSMYSHCMNSKQLPVQYFFDSAIPAEKRKYAAVLHRLDIDHVSGRIVMGISDKVTLTKQYNAEPKWEKEVVDVSQMGYSDKDNRIDYWIVLSDSAKTVYNRTKYLAFFENEADAKAYDLSIKSYSINGIKGVVDNIAHTITINDHGGSAADFENAQPVMVSDPLATIATESTINYEDDIVYNVTNVLGEQITYTVKFNYGEDVETPEGAFAIRYNTIKKIEKSAIESEYDGIVPTLTYDEENKAVEISGMSGHNHERLFIRTPIANLSKYKYAKIKYMYADGTGRDISSNNTIGNGISFDKGEKGKTMRTGMYPDLIDGTRLYSKKWFTDIVDVSSLTGGRDNADGISFNAMESSYSGAKQNLVLKIKYIALFENYADAVSYDSTDKFTAPAELEPVTGTLSVKTTVDYVEDYGNTSLAIAVYKDGTLLDVAFSAAPTYTPDASISSNWSPSWLEQQGSKQWCMNSELKTTLSATLDVSDYEADTYTAKVMMIGKDSVLPYCNVAEYTLTVAERNGQKQVRVAAVTED